jgi:hypothetical protein
MKICLVIGIKLADGETSPPPTMQSFISLVISIHLITGNDKEFSDDNVTNKGESDIYYFGDQQKIICSW